MKKILNKIDKMLIAAKVKISMAVQEERGDTNFISILVILGVVLLLATTFMGFKDRIVQNVSEIVNNFTIK